MEFPIDVRKWLNNRGITDEVIKNNDLYWKFDHIVIPIKDLHGNITYNKYRRSPFINDGPKYRYDSGAQAQLFHGDKIAGRGSVIICEGEMDAMRLEAAGYVAVTGTGGAGTFRDEWVSLLGGKDLYIAYDNDEAGMKGAGKLLTKLDAKLVSIPETVNGIEVKDVTDFLQAKGLWPLLLENAESFSYLSAPLPEMKFIKDYRMQIKSFNYHLEQLLVKERGAKNLMSPYRQYDVIRSLLLVAIDNLKREIRKKRFVNKPGTMGQTESMSERIVKAKQIPLTTLYADRLVTMGGKATGICPFHNEKTGSFTIYIEQNKFYCYGCSAGGDSIDYVMRTKNCDFISAIKSMTT